MLFGQSLMRDLNIPGLSPSHPLSPEPALLGVSQHVSSQLNLALLSFVPVLCMRSTSISPRNNTFTIGIRIRWGFALNPLFPC